MRVTMSPIRIKVTNQEPDGDETWTHTLEAESEYGSSVSLLLSREVFQQLWAMCERPMEVGDV